MWRHSIIARALTTDGKKLPREMVSVMTYDSSGQSYAEMMQASLKEEMAPRRLAPKVPPKSSEARAPVRSDPSRPRRARRVGGVRGCQP